METCTGAAVLVAGVGGFVPHFEKNNVQLLNEKNYGIIYVADFDNPVYSYSSDFFARNKIDRRNVNFSKKLCALGSHYKAYRKLKGIIRGCNPSLVHCHTPIAAALTRLAAGRKFAGKMIYTTHGFHFYKGSSVKGWFYKRIEKHLAKYTDVIITINEEDYKAAGEFKLKPGGRVVKIPGVGADLDKLIMNPEARRELRQQYGMGEDDFHLISAGELNDNKNHISVIKAIEKLNNPHIYYSIYGEGDKRQELEAAIEKAGLGDRVFLRGFTDKLEQCLASGDCFAFPSVREGLGMAAIEALAIGLPVVAADNRGTREYMVDGVNGYVYEPMDVDAIATAILKVYNSKKEWSVACRASVEAFDEANTEAVMRTVYASVS